MLLEYSMLDVYDNCLCRECFLMRFFIILYIYFIFIYCFMYVSIYLLFGWYDSKVLFVLIYVCRLICVICVIML